VRYIRFIIIICLFFLFLRIVLIIVLSFQQHVKMTTETKRANSGLGKDSVLQTLSLCCTAAPSRATLATFCQALTVPTQPTMLTQTTMMMLGTKLKLQQMTPTRTVSMIMVIVDAKGGR
jgi:hypothetical protein